MCRYRSLFHKHSLIISITAGSPTLIQWYELVYGYGAAISVKFEKIVHGYRAAISVKVEKIVHE